MGDPCHLEKMGRELKCPICLSLLNSAVSLTCNHVFCNACISKSMKLGSNCPVCKVPYRRREVRAAPHMDNLVSIYKSMEAASGINIFVTQNTSSTKLSDEEKQAEGNFDCHGKKESGNHHNTQEDWGISKEKAFKRTMKSNLETSGLTTTKPSFPTKKRVQLRPYSSSDTPEEPTKSGVGSVKDAEDELAKSSILKGILSSNEKGKPVLSPFFWLREEDVEKTTQHTDEDLLVDATPPSIPSFSDMRDSDDENPNKVTPSAEVHGNPNFVDCHDSEMFEWTQRTCSPELVSSPIKMQVSNTEEHAVIQERKPEGFSWVPNTDAECLIGSEKYAAVKATGIDDIAEEALPDKSSAGAKYTNNQHGNDKLKGKRRKVRGITQKKGAKKNKGQDSENCVDSRKESGVIAMHAKDNHESSFKLEELGKRRKKGGFGGCAARPMDECVYAGPTQTMEQEKDEFIGFPASLGMKQVVDDNLNMDKTGKKFRNTNSLYPKGSCLRSKRQKQDSTKISGSEEASTIEKKTDENSYPLMSSLFVPMGDTNAAADFLKKSREPTRKSKHGLNSKCNQEKGYKEVSLKAISKNELVDCNLKSHGSVSAKEYFPAGKVHYSSGVRVLDDLSTVNKLSLTNGVALHKCEALPKKIQCAFCLSSENSEASGEMVHYCNGKPVAADYDGEFKVVHSHKDCTEWAPNVYFEGDTAINLEAEISRSKRINCCCCGLKGAALGCYERSCRKSFHVPCAKLTPQCRWDHDNFVILCPLHASSKLPNEYSESQERRRKKCILKGEVPNQTIQAASKQDISLSLKWNSSGSPDKLILCCSALTAEDKEVISKFEKLSKVTVLKKWNASVTHVIASTDENGACRRTLKILMGILEGKWILNIEWVKASMEAMKAVKEEPYEISHDIHGIRGGPRLGRLRLQNKQPKIFDGICFYLMGDFIPSYKGYLQELIVAAGGTMLHRKPILEDQGGLKSRKSTLIIYSLELPDKCAPSKNNTILNQRRVNAEALASSTGAKEVSNSWVLDSIAASKLQSLPE